MTRDPEDFLDFLRSPVQSRQPVLTAADGMVEDVLSMLSAEQLAVRPTPRVATVPIVQDVLEPFRVLGHQTTELEALLHSNLSSRLLSIGPFAMSEIKANPFSGDGVYALYYQGELPIYEKIRSLDSTYPIYVGKSAQPARTSGKSKGRDRNMHGRLLTEHAQSLRQAGFPLEDFTFRFVILADNWVDLSEYALVKMFRPAWNTIIHGFGSRCYAKDTRGSAGLASVWDTLHPGRIGAGTKQRDLDAEILRLSNELPECIRVYESTMAKLV